MPIQSADSKTRSRLCCPFTVVNGSMMASLFLAWIFSAPLLAQTTITAHDAMRRLGLPCVDVSYGPHKGVFVLDTGASVTVAFQPVSLVTNPDPEWVVRPISAKLVGGETKGHIVGGISVSAFDKEFPHARMAYIPLLESDPMFPRFLNGALGFPELEALCVRFDRGATSCELWSRPGEPPQEFSRLSMYRMPLGSFEISGDLPTQKDFRFQLDTGSAKPIQLRKQTIERLTRTGAVVPWGVTRTTGGRNVPLHILQSITIGNLKFVNVPVTESNFEAIGYGCLSHIDMIADFATPNLWVNSPDVDAVIQIAPDASGLRLSMEEPLSFSILEVAPNSAAAKHSLAVGDQIVGIDGASADRMTMLEVRQRLTCGGTKLPLRIRRGDKEFDLILPLEWQFEYPPKWPPRDQQIQKFEKFLEEQREKEKAGSKQ